MTPEMFRTAFTDFLFHANTPRKGIEFCTLGKRVYTLTCILILSRGRQCGFVHRVPPSRCEVLPEDSCRPFPTLRLRRSNPGRSKSTKSVSEKELGCSTPIPNLEPRAARWGHLPASRGLRHAVDALVWIHLTSTSATRGCGDRPGGRNHPLPHLYKCNIYFDRGPHNP